MKIAKSVHRRACLFLIVTGIILVNFVAGPLSIVIQSAEAQFITTITRKWRSEELNGGNWEGGHVVADIVPGVPGAEIIYGALIVPELDDRLRVTIIASGVNSPYVFDNTEPFTPLVEDLKSDLGIPKLT